MNKKNIKDSQNFITSKYHIEKIMNCISLDEKDKDIEFVDNEIVIINEEMKGTMEEIGVNEDK